jgi:hypothetical protein
METVIIKMSWKWGGVKVIACSTSLTVEEVAQENGFTAVNGREPLFIFKGRILQPQLTFHHYDIRDGASIVAYIGFACPILPIRFSEALFASRRTQRINEARDNENARLVDQDFMLWEMVRSYPEVLAECLREDQEREEKDVPAVKTEKTVVKSSHEISVSPLPLMLKGEDGFRQRDRLGSWSDGC